MRAGAAEESDGGALRPTAPSRRAASGWHSRAAPLPPAAAWQLPTRCLSLDRPLVMGIVNVTPDSFSDGGLFFSPDAAVARAAALIAEGADILDIGGESTRPQGAVPVTAAEERARVMPVIEALRARFPEAVLSVDTVKSAVADAALGAGVEIINDVSGFRLDRAMPAVCARRGAAVVLMHSRGGVSEMGTYAHAEYPHGVVAAVLEELRASLDGATGAGIARDAVALDPGIGFSKRTADSVSMLAALDRVVALGAPVVVGVSRKRVIGELSGVGEPARRGDGTTAANVLALAAGVRIFRVHDALAARRALDVAWAILAAREADGEADA